MNKLVSRKRGMHVRSVFSVVMVPHPEPTLRADLNASLTPPSPSPRTPPQLTPWWIRLLLLLASVKGPGDKMYLKHLVPTVLQSNALPWAESAVALGRVTGAPRGSCSGASRAGQVHVQGTTSTTPPLQNAGEGFRWAWGPGRGCSFTLWAFTQAITSLPPC